MIDNQLLIVILKRCIEEPQIVGNVIGQSDDRVKEMLTDQIDKLKLQLGECPGCESRDGFLDPTKYMHTCCPYQQHVVGDCDCQERWDT